MWKRNWDETREHFEGWWRREGLLLGMWGAPRAAKPHAPLLPEPPPPASPAAGYLDYRARARREFNRLAQSEFPADILPAAETNMGPGSLALMLGCEPGFSRETVWFEPCWQRVAEPETLPPLQFDPANRWWRLTEDTLRTCVELSQGNYLAGCPDLVENVDILAALRDPQTLLLDMIERPEWVEQRVQEITAAWFAAYQRIYDLVKAPDGSSSFCAFRVWGPGKAAKVQCDASAMFSPAMFARFVTPALTAQCEWLDHSLYHLDGTQALGHLEALLAIEPLDAIEWTPQAGIEGGGHPRWWPLYKRILAAGKGVQAVGVQPDEVLPLLDAIGGRGVYLVTHFPDLAAAEALAAKVEPYRR